MADHYILMGDVNASTSLPPEPLQKNFMDLVSGCNRALSDRILSPYTITLGDEFQGIAASLEAVVESIFWMEEERIRKGYPFFVRYVAHFGAIQTALNPEVAYGMMGPGLARARAVLSAKRRGRPRFFFDLPESRRSLNLNRLFKVVDALVTQWKPEDFTLILDMLVIRNNQELAIKHGKNRSQIWKRRKTLLLEEYRVVKEVILDLAGE